jgi:heptosyltransferase-1
MQIDIKECKRILIVKLSSIGDVVMTTPVAKALRQAAPDAYIAWVVEDKAKDMLIGNPYLDEIIIWKRNSTSRSVRKRASGLLLGFARLTPVLRARKFDLVIDFQGLLRSGLVTGSTMARWRLGFDNAREGAAMFYNLHFPAQRRVRGPQQYLSMLEPLNIVSEDLDMHVPLSDDDLAFAGEFISQKAESGNRIVALCPATTWPHKHWREQGWAELADALISDYGATPIFLGSPADGKLVGRIQDMMKCKAVSAVGKTTLNQAAALIKSSDTVISVDTGLLHISLALDRPTVGIFGPTRWQHFSKKDNFAVAAKELACMPCLRHPTCKQYDCMTFLTTEEVLAKAKPWLAAK